MAKQNKKFVATTLTAAMVASAVAPVAGAAFTDSIPNYAKDAVDYVTGKGIMNGLGGTTEFGAAKNITRAEVAVLLSNALGLDTKGKTADFTDVPEKHWASGAIAAVVEAGIAKGTDKGFEPAKNITRQEAAVMFANAYKELKLNEKTEVSFKDESKVATWAKGQVEVLASLGIFGGKTGGVFAPTDLITRGEVATLVHRTEVADVRLEIKEVVTTATKVASVSATNLKEVEVKFDGTVDAASASDEEKYSLASGSVDSAEVLEDGKTVRLTVVGKLSNQVANKLTVSGVKAGDKSISQSEIAFTPLDNELPKVTEVKNLGTKALKVVFSEPIQKAVVGNFTIDGKPYYGSVTEGSREVILTPYDSTTLTVGDHTITVAGVEDYFGLKALSSDHKFTVVEDKVAPKVGNVEATLERAVVTFSEEIDPSTVHASNVYWKQGDTKKYANGSKKLGSDKYEFSFTTNPLPAFETTLYVEGVKDYSGNTITETTVKVSAKVDQTRPEVTEVKADSANAKNINVKFSKVVNAADKKYFTVLDKDGKAQPILEVVPADGSGQVFTVKLYNDLKQGQNTIKISGVKDKTALENTMFDYESVIGVKDTTPPTIVGAVSASNSSRSVIITFSEQMDLASIANQSNYLINWSADGAATPSLRQLPTGTQVTPVQNGKAVLITFPEKLGNTDITFPQTLPTFIAGTVKGIQVMGVKDTSGNVLANFSELKTTSVVSANLTAYGSGVTKNAILTDKTTVKVKFDQAIGTAKAGDFTTSISGVSVQSATADGSDVVTLKLSGSVGTTIQDGDLRIANGNGLKTVNGNTVETTGASITIADQVKPEVVLVSGQRTLDTNGPTIDLPFSETLSSTNVGLMASDLTVINLSTNQKVTLDKITTTVAGNVLKIRITGEAGEFSVKVNSNATYIKDVAGNTAVESATYETARGTVDGVAPTLSSAVALDINGDGTIDTFKVTFSENVDDSTLDATKFTGYTVTGAATPESLTTAGITDVVDDNVLYLTVSGITGSATSATKLTLVAGAIADLAGNVSVANATGVSVADNAAAVVTIKLPAANTFTTAAVQTLVFSEELSATSKAAVLSAVQTAYTTTGTTAVVTVAWGTGASANTLTVTLGGTVDASNTVVLAAITPIAVTDLAGITSTALALQ